MKKSILIVLTILILCCFISCSKGDKSAVNSDTSNTVKLSSSNAYKLNYTNMYNKICTLVNNTAIGSSYVEFYFRPDGLITRFAMGFGTLEKKSNETNHYIGEYNVGDYLGLRIDGQEGVASLEVNKSYITTFATYLDKKTDYTSFKKLMNNLDSLDLKKVVGAYKIDSPVFFSFVTGPYKQDVILDQNANTTYLYWSGSNFQQVAKPDIPYPTLYNLELLNYDYYVIVPYYEKTDSISGVDEITVGQSNAITYVGKNLLIILKDKDQ